MNRIFSNLSISLEQLDIFICEVLVTENSALLRARELGASQPSLEVQLLLKQMVGPDRENYETQLGSDLL